MTASSSRTATSKSTALSENIDFGLNVNFCLTVQYSVELLMFSYTVDRLRYNKRIKRAYIKNEVRSLDVLF